MRVKRETTDDNSEDDVNHVNVEVSEPKLSVSAVKFEAFEDDENFDKFPENFAQQLHNLRITRRLIFAPVDEKSFASDIPAKDRRFQILVSLILSSQTRDKITHQVTKDLFRNGYGTLEGLLKIDRVELEKMIKPVGFYNRKSYYLKRMAEMLRDDFSSDIPNTIKDICKLPGAGPKVAHLCMSEAWGVTQGIGVDTHVHRISARLKWTPPGLNDADLTRKHLEEWLPRQLWREINPLLVGLGQTICLANNRKCQLCFNKFLCPSSLVKYPELKELEKKAKKRKIVIKDDA